MRYKSVFAALLAFTVSTSAMAKQIYVTKGGGNPQQYAEAWRKAKSCDSDRAHSLSPREVFKDVKLPKSRPADAQLRFQTGWRFNLACTAPAWAIPQKVNLTRDAGVDGQYAGARDMPADEVARFFSVSVGRYFDDKLSENERSALGARIVDALTEAARVEALTKNNRSRYGTRPFDYPTMNAVFSATVAFVALEEVMTSEQKEKVYSWLTPLLEAALNSKWGGAPDNKSVYREAIGAFWGRYVGRPDLVQRAAEAYKFHVKYMRSDGTFGRDASRGGTGVHYNTLAANAMIFIAAMDAMDGGNLFEFSLDGKDIHAPVSFMLDFAEDKSVNKRYARQCEGGSIGTIDEPNTFLLKVTDEGTSNTAMRVYGARYPDAPVTERLFKNLPALATSSASSDFQFGALGCLLGSLD